MRTLLRILVGLAVLAAPGFAQQQHPNVVIIYGDDVGFGDVGAYGCEEDPDAEHRPARAAGSAVHRRPLRGGDPHAVAVLDADRHPRLPPRRARPAAFLFFSSQDIHVPRAPHPRFRGKSGLSYRGDAMVQLDWATGEILAALDQHGLADRTIVIFSSDNGPVYDDGYVDGTTVRTSTEEVDRGHDASGPYRGGKYQIYEGGTRVPFVIRWPGRIEPGRSAALVNQIDFVASFAALLGITLEADQGIDSRDTLAAFLGEDARGLPWMIEEASGVALRQGAWKFIPARGKQRRGQLYDLDTDVGERRDLIAENPERAEELRARLQALVTDRRGLRAHSLR